MDYPGDGLLAGERVLWEAYPVYQVTNYRVSLRGKTPWSAYLDQIDDPVVRMHADGTGDVLLRRYRRERSKNVTTRAFRDLPDAKHACDLIAQARYRMLAGSLELPAPQAPQAPPGAPAIPVPPGIDLGSSEQVLWTGRPEDVRWWYGERDVREAVLTACAGFGWLLAVTGLAGRHAAFVAPWAPLYAVSRAVSVIVRRHRVRRSVYVLTSERLIAAWRKGRHGRLEVAQARLDALLPPHLAGPDIFNAVQGPRPHPYGLRHAWPFTTGQPPALIGVRDPGDVRDLICTAQLARKAPRLPAPLLPGSGMPEPGTR